MASRTRHAGKRRRIAATPADRAEPAAGPAAVRFRTRALVLGVYGVAFTLLAVGSGFQLNATVDEPMHLVAGYGALVAGDYRLDPTHPPLVRVWAALPLLTFQSSPAPTAAIDQASPRTWLESSGPTGVAREFLFSQSDADRWLNTSRLMIILLGLGTGVLVFLWADEWLGFRAAVSALAFYTLSPSILAHTALVTTDFGVTAFIFASVYLLWRTCRRPTWGHMLGLAGSVAAAIVTKFSAAVLGPIVIVLLVFALWRRMGVTTTRAIAVVGVISVTVVVAIWAAYGWRYAPSASPGWIFDVAADAASHPAVPFARVAAWIDTHHLLPNAFTQGVLSTSIGSIQRAYLLGQLSDHGWWYYFPVAFLVKTPIALIALVTIGLATYVTRRDRLGLSNEAFVVLPVGLYLAGAMASGINIGVRHILPIEPFLFLIAGAAADALIGARRSTGRLAFAGLVALMLIEIGRTYPHTLNYFNELAGGPEHGLEYLADSNLDWGQHLKLLKRWMDEHDVQHINLAYFGQADPQYYRINCTYLPATLTFASRVAQPPKLPGFVAISATVLSGVYLDPQLRVFYSGFRHRPPTAEIGHSIRVYWVERWPEADDAAEYREYGGGPGAEAAVADRLLFELRWPEIAAAYYRHYLQHRPTDSTALANYGTALEVTGDVAGGVAALRNAVAVAPNDASLHVSLGLSLITAGQPVEAEAEAKRAIALKPANPSAVDLLGRAYALQGRLAEAVAEFERALKIDPGYEPARADLERIRAVIKRRVPDSPRLERPARVLEHAPV